MVRSGRGKENEWKVSGKRSRERGNEWLDQLVRGMRELVGAAEVAGRVWRINGT